MNHLTAGWAALGGGKDRGLADPRTWVGAAMNLTWGDDESDHFGEGNYCLDHGFAKKVELEAEGETVFVRLHHNYGEGCEVCNGKVDLDDPRVESDGDDWWRVKSA